MHREELVAHWRALVGCMLAASVGAMGFYLYTIGAFVPALIADAGYTKEQLSLGSLFVAGSTALCAPFAGMLMDRFGALRIVGLSIAGQVAALLLLGASPATYPVFIACLVLFAAVGTGMAPPSFARMITARFDRARGFALGLSVCGLGVMAIVLPIVTTWLIQRIGWRLSYVAAAALVSVLGTAGALLVRSDGVPGQPPAPRLRQGRATGNGLRRPLFWILVAGFMVSALFSNGYLLHLILLLRERGFEPASAAKFQAVVGVAMLLGRISTGLALDRFSAPLVASVTFGVCGLGCALLLQTEPALVVLATFAIGLAIGAELDLLAYFVSRYFGLEQFGQLYGLAYGLLLIAVGASPILISFLAARGGYSFALTVSAAGILIGSTMLFFLPNPRGVEEARSLGELPAPASR